MEKHMELIYNAKIKYSFLGFDDNKNLVIQLGFDYERGTIQTEQTQFIDAFFIQEILDTLELNRWEDLPRKFARIKINESKKIIAIGNLIEERWVKI